MGYLGGSQSYRWGGAGAADGPDPYVGKHDMWHDHGPGVDIVPEIGYSTSFYAMQAVRHIEGRNSSRPLWLHVAFQAVHGART